MMNANFGSDGFWNALGCLVVIGLIAVVVGAIAGIVWLINHVKIDW